MNPVNVRETPGAAAFSQQPETMRARLADGRSCAGPLG